MTRHRSLVGNILVLGFASAALFAYIGGSSYVFEGIHEVSASMYSLIFAVNSIGQLLVGAAFSRLARRVRMNTLLTVSVTLAVAGALAQVLITAGLGENFAASWITQFVILAALGTAVPATITLGQNLGRRAPGAASALLGGLQFLPRKECLDGGVHPAASWALPPSPVLQDRVKLTGRTLRREQLATHGHDHVHRSGPFRTLPGRPDPPLAGPRRSHRSLTGPIPGPAATDLHQLPTTRAALS